jgi:uncharacterized protein (TIRG00374 family)
MKKFIFALFVSAIFIYLTFKGIDFQQLYIGLKGVKYHFLIPGIGLIMLISFLRSLRWGIILSPLEKIGQKKLIPLTCIGYMAVIVVPMRIGELLRPYLLSTNSEIPTSTAIGTIVIERSMDIMTILCILFGVVYTYPSPDWIINTGYSLLPLFLSAICFLFLFYFNNDLTLRIIKPVIGILPEKLARKLEGLLKNLMEGFSIISSPSKIFYALILTAIIWISSALSIYCLFYFLNLQLSLISAFMVLILTILGVSIPAAPGMVGNFQYASIIALSIFNVSKTDAFLFSMVYYFLGIGLAIIFGLVFLPLVNISIKDLKKAFDI